MKLDTKKILEEVGETGEKVLEGARTLGNIEQLDIATAPKEAVYQTEDVTLYHYYRETEAQVKTPVLLCYALVNRPDMLDLQPDRSLIRKLLEKGLDIYLIDWGYPTKADRYRTMDDYINWFMDDMVDHIRKSHDINSINLAGICQGGTFSTIYSALHPEKINNLITFVTPIDFSNDDGLLNKWVRDMDVDRVVDSFGGMVPGSFMNFGFALINPMIDAHKMVGIYNDQDDHAKMMNFMRMEKWINDSPDQAGECFRQYLKDLYQENKLAKGELEVGGERVDLSNITMPLLNIYAKKDNLVPPASTKPLNDLVSSADSETYEFPGGHIGVFVGSKSQKDLGPTVANWLYDRDA